MLTVMKSLLARFVTDTVQLCLQLYPNYTQQNPSTLDLGIVERVCGLLNSASQPEFRAVAYSGIFSRFGSTISVEDRGQRERGSGARSL